MNKKYIDFVPSKSVKKATAIKKTTRGAGAVTTATRAKTVSGVKRAATKPVAAKAAPVRARNITAKEVKAKKVGLKEAQPTRARAAAVEKPVEKSVRTEANKKVMAIPRAQFINQNKVEKRPLSKNVYQKKIEATKEVPTGPVTIISKPEKDKHVSIVVTIIITIILGAAAGTVAFLLLPK